MDIGDRRSADDFQAHLHSVGRKVLPIIFGGIFARAVANPILKEIFKNMIHDVKQMWLERFFSFAALLEADLSAGFAAGKDLVDMVRGERPVGWKYLLQLTAGCLYSLRRRRALPRHLLDSFTNLAVDIEVALGLPRSQKTRRARDIRGELVKALAKH